MPTIINHGKEKVKEEEDFPAEEVRKGCEGLQGQETESLQGVRQEEAEEVMLL
jgi:hypothetical protein